jgi:hypothetical protein
MKAIKGLLLTVGIAGGLLAASTPRVSGTPAAPTPEMAQKERRSCVTCHTALGRPDLNRIGDYYKEHRTLEDYPGELPPREGEPPAPAPREPGPLPQTEIHR